MLLAVAMLTTLVDGVVTVPKGHWQSVAFDIVPPTAAVDVIFAIPAHVSRIQIEVVSAVDAQRFQQGRSYRPLCVSGYQRSGRMRCSLPEAGKYFLLIDNRLDSRFDAKVDLKVEAVGGSAVPRTLSPERRFVVITASILFFLGLVAYSARQLIH